MKILVFSDSHGNSKNIKNALEIHGGVCDLVIFLGDGIKDIEYIKEKYPDITFYIVKGNCDLFQGGYQGTSVLDLDGIRVLITHGHLYNAKYGYERLVYAALENEADAVFFGHTHIPTDEIVDCGQKRVHLFNPGSIGHGGTYGVVNTSGKVLVSSHGKI